MTLTELAVVIGCVKYALQQIELKLVLILAVMFINPTIAGRTRNRESRFSKVGDVDRGEWKYEANRLADKLRN